MKNPPPAADGASVDLPPAPPPTGQGALGPWAAMLILACLVVAIYSNSVQAPMIFDDIPNIGDNPHIRLTRIAPGPLMAAAFQSPSSRRPVANLTFALNHYVHGYRVAGYHWVNIAIHILTGIMFGLLLQTTAKSMAGAAADRPGQACLNEAPFWAALVWAVHPLHTQTVTYIVQRMNALAALFFVMSLLFYARARLASGKWEKRPLGGACGLAAVLAMGSKEIAATLPFFIFLYEWYFFQDLSRVWLRRRMPVLVILAAAGLVLVWLFLGADPLQRLTLGYAHRDFSLIERVLTQFRVVVFYISLVGFPHPSRLNLDHDLSLSHALTDPPSTLAAIGLIAGLCLIAVVSARRHRAASFCILWFLGNLAIESSVIGLEMVFEHRTYLPSMAAAAGFILIACRFIRADRIRRVLFMAVVAVFSFWTYERNALWQDPLTLWTDAADKSPGKARPNNTAGVAWEGRGRIDVAKAYYLKALAADPRDVYAYVNLGNLAYREGRAAAAEDFYRKALHLVPANAEAHNNLATLLVESGRIAEGADHYQKAARANPRFAEAHRNLGALFWRQDRAEDAAAALSRALDIDPQDAEAHYLLGSVLTELGRGKAAFAHFNEALRLNPNHVEAHHNLGVLMDRLGRRSAAIDQFQTVLRLKPDHAAARENLERAMADGR